MNRLIILFLFTSCTTQKKVEKWMDRNNAKAAEMCDVRFPLIEKTDTAWITDSAKLKQYESEYQFLTNYINELLNEGCDTLTVEKVIEKITQLPAKPCPTKVVTKTVENTARITILRDSILVLNRTTAKQEQKIFDLNDKVKNRTKQRNWLFIICLLLTAWTFRKLFRYVI